MQSVRKVGFAPVPPSMRHMVAAFTPETCSNLATLKP